MATKASKDNEARKFGVSDPYWDGLSEHHKDMYRQVRPLRKATYTVHHPIGGIERTLAQLANDAEKLGGSLELNPDFQRGHVWDRPRQVAFMESVLRGLAPMTIRFNCANWSMHDADLQSDLNPHDMVCVDGLQRLTAMRAFVAGEFPVFGSYYAKDLENSPFSLSRTTGMWIMEVFDIKTRRDLLTFYLDINRGGVVHTDEELARVEALRDGAEVETASPGKKARKR